MAFRGIRNLVRIRTRIKDWRNEVNARPGHLPSKLPIPIRREVKGKNNIVAQYWNRHTVRSQIFNSAEESLKHVEAIDRSYPLYHQFMCLYAGYDHQIVVDYGCGPGNDLVGFLTYSGAKKVIGIDVSEAALSLASARLGLHTFSPSRIELILISDSLPEIPLESDTVDYIHSQGVLHHATNPQAILEQFNRILKPGGTARIMIYNYNSVFVHLSVAYRRMIVNQDFPGQTLKEAFARSTDGKNCPISRYYKPEEFSNLCENAGFQCSFVGGYLNIQELAQLNTYREQAINDVRLDQEHANFLRDLTFDDANFPLYGGKYAGVGGVYELNKPER